MPNKNQSGRQVIDHVAQANQLVIGFGPSIAMVHAYLAQSHTLSLMLTNSAYQQQQQAALGLATTSASVIQLFSKKRRRRRRRKQQRNEQEEPAPEAPTLPNDFLSYGIELSRAGEITPDMTRLESNPTAEEMGNNMTEQESSLTAEETGNMTVQ